VVAHDGVLGVGEGHSSHPGPGTLQQVGHAAPLGQGLPGQARSVVLLAVPGTGERGVTAESMRTTVLRVYVCLSV